MEKNHAPSETQYAPLSQAAAHRRAETWRVLHESGASLIWHPVAIDKALNASELEPVSSIQSAAAAAIQGEPRLHESLPELLGILNGTVQRSPFWIGFVRPQALRLTPVSIRDSGVVDQCADEVWGEMCRIEKTYNPVGTDVLGKRPHYYYNYLQVCLRTVVRKTSQLCFDAMASSMDDPLNPTQYADANIQAPSAGIENRECREALEKALHHIRREPRMERVFNLLVIRGLTLRDAEMVSGLGKSSIQRDAEAMVGLLQNAFVEQYDWTPRGAPDAFVALSAMRTVLDDMGYIHDAPNLMPIPGKIIATPRRDEFHHLR